MGGRGSFTKENGPSYYWLGRSPKTKQIQGGERAMTDRNPLGWERLTTERWERSVDMEKLKRMQYKSWGEREDSK
jgi:hypothetical protein